MPYYRRRTGDYGRTKFYRSNVRAPASMAIAAGGVTPTLQTRGETKLIEGQELVFNLTNSWTPPPTGPPPPPNNLADWQVSAAYMNPLEPFFPILAAESASYQLYRFTKLTLCYENTCPSSTVGQVYLGMLADPADELPNVVQEATAIKASVRGPVWAPIEMSVPVDKTFRYINGSEVTDADLRNIMQCRIWAAMYNVDVGLNVGTVRVKYSCELKKRITPQSLSLFDVTATAVPTSNFLPNLITAITSRRVPRWYKINPLNTNQLIVRSYGTYLIQLSLTDITDEDFIALLSTGPGITIKDKEGNILGAETLYATPFRTPGYTNDNGFTLSAKFIMPDNDGYIDWTGINVLTGPLSGYISIDRQ